MPEKQYFTGIDVINAPRIESLTVTEDGTYTASSDVIGYNPIIVNTNPPWQPLKDGYSNFWFELTNDTLSPWLNFSAKNNDAVIDWGDGSGEQALDTLTPTHTYSKAGRYVVKCKGVTRIAPQMTLPYEKSGSYSNVLKYVELNSEVVAIAALAFRYVYSLKQVIIANNEIVLGNGAFTACSTLNNVELPLISALSSSTFYSCGSLDTMNLPSTLTSIGASAYAYCSAFKTITIPRNVSDIGNYAFSGCYSLTELHLLPTVPPTLGTNVLQNIASNYIIYVPVGTGDTYKAASGWNAYADHILEEGQTPNRAMLAKLNSYNTDNEETR